MSISSHSGVFNSSSNGTLGFYPSDTDYASLYFITNLIAYTLNVLLSFPVNSYVIWLIATGAGNGLAAEFFTFNRSISEVLLSLNCVLSVVGHYYYYAEGAAEVLNVLVTASRSVFLCLMCVERFLAVVHPLTFLKLKPLRYRVFCAVLVWTASLVALAVFVVASLFTQFQVIFYLIWPQIIFYTLVQLFCCVSVLRALNQSGPGERGRERKEEDLRKRKAFQIICVIFLTLVVTYVPFLTLSYLQSIDLSLSVNVILIVQFFSTACYLLSGLSIPLLFLHRVKKLPFVQLK